MFPRLTTQEIGSPGNDKPAGPARQLFASLAGVIVLRPGSTLCLWLVVAAILAWSSPGWQQTCQDDDIRFLPDYCASVQGYGELIEAFPAESFGSKLIVVLEAAGKRLSARELEQARRLQQRLERLRREEAELGLRGVRGPADPLLGSRLVSADERAALLVVGLQSPFLATRTRQAVDRIEAVLRAELPAGVPVRLHLTGPAGVGRDLGVAVVESIHGTTWATVALVLGTLLAVYRAPMLAMIPVVSIGLAVWLANELLLLLAGWGVLRVVNLTPVFVVVLLFGVGTDYSLFLLSRCREEWQTSGDLRLAVQRAVTQVGWPLTASALAVMVGLCMLGWAEFVKLRVMGMSLALSLGIGLLAALTLTPALLLIVGEAAFWPRHRATWQARSRLNDEYESWMIRQVRTRPAGTWLVTVAALLPLAWLGWHTSAHYSVKQDLPTDAPSLHGLAVIERSFQPGELGPITLLLTQPEPWTKPLHLQRLGAITQALQACPGVAEVRSLPQPIGATPAHRATEGWSQTLWTTAAMPIYLGRSQGGHVARVEIILEQNPLESAAFDLLPTLMAVAEQASAANRPAPPSTRLRWFGMPVILHDVVQVQRADGLVVFTLVLVSIYVIMSVLLRRPGLALYLLATVLFSYFATLGATQIASVLLLGGVWGQLDWKVLFFLFTILIAVGADYNIFLMSRVLEEREVHGWRAGILRALRRTGVTITSCGLIMAGTFATLVLGSLHTLQQLGLALALGVLLDTFVVRFLLVPTFLLWWHRHSGPLLYTQPTAAQPATAPPTTLATLGYRLFSRRAA
jgi:RND superfamily putative drug exporter